MDSAGDITKEHTVWCGYGDCIEWSQYCTPTKKETAERARDEGWVLTKKYGWICDNHRLMDTQVSMERSTDEDNEPTPR